MLGGALLDLFKIQHPLFSNYETKNLNKQPRGKCAYKLQKYKAIISPYSCMNRLSAEGGACLASIS